MKLPDFSQDEKWNALRKKMGAEYSTFETESKWQGINDDILRKLEETGEVEGISLDQLEIKNDGVFEYKGQKLIVYIRDQYQKYRDKNDGYKFHLTKCQTIESFDKNNRNSRYVISKKQNGLFDVNLVDRESKKLIEKKQEFLKPCKNCLKEINYKDYKNNKEEIYKNFQLKEYFERYPSTNLDKTKYRDSDTAPLNEYTANWEQVSFGYREKQKWICEGCSINLEDNSKFLHVHHIDADKSNNDESNLKALCIECHSQEPEHKRLEYNSDYKEFQNIKNTINP